MGKTQLCKKKNCKYEDKDIEYQLKKEKKKETWYLQPWKENPIQTFTP